MNRDSIPMIGFLFPFNKPCLTLPTYLGWQFYLKIMKITFFNVDAQQAAGPYS